MSPLTKGRGKQHPGKGFVGRAVQCRGGEMFRFGGMDLKLDANNYVVLVVQDWRCKYELYRYRDNI